MASNDQPSGLERGRIGSGLTLLDVASKLGRCTTSVRRWELGRTTPPQHVMLMLAKLYGVSPAELVD